MLYSISVCACSVTQSMAFSRQDCWSGLWFSPPGDLSDPGFEPASPLSPASASGLFTPEPLVVQSLSYLWLFVTPWTAACQASLSITNFCSLLKLMSIESLMPSNHLIICHPLLLCLSESGLCIRWPKYWSFSFSISPSNKFSGLIFFKIDWL